MFIFHKTEVQTVILKCLMSLNPNWYKKLWHKTKNPRSANEYFCTKSQKTRNANICSFCHNQSEFTPVKHIKMTVWTSFLWKITYSWQKNGQKWSQSGHLWLSFVLTQTICKLMLLRCGPPFLHHRWMILWCEPTFTM